MKQIISEFVSALDEEIATLKSGKGGNITKVFDGKFLREVPNGFVYLFHLENFLATLDDSPAEIEIKGERYPAQILLTQGLEVEVCIESYCGETVAEGSILTNLWYLLELLKKKFIASEDLVNKFKISDALFSGYISDFPKIENNITPQFSPSDHEPNEAQKKAINKSFYQPLSIIWGPPGTGKTTTIAKAIEAHLNAGRKVLLVSHANNAVDQALLDVAKQMKNTAFYNDGELVRLGTPTDTEILSRFEKEYNMVLMDKISEKLGASLVEEKNQLLKNIEQFEKENTEFTAVYNQIISVESLIEESEATSKNIQQITNKLNLSNSEINNLKQRQIAEQDKLKEANASGTFKRLFKGLKPEKIQLELDKISISLDSCQRQNHGLREQQSQFKAKYEYQKIQIERLKIENEKELKRLGITSKAQINEKISALNNDIQGTEKRIGEINKILDEIQKNILLKAKLVATTLTKTFTDKRFDELQFDVLFVDEASMTPLPYVYWAASKCNQFVTIAGDFLQLPPIAVSKGIMSKKWLARSIFDILEITTVEGADKHPLVTLLDTQYRMVPKIGEIPKNFFYGGKLRHGNNTDSKNIDDGVSNDSLILIQTDNMNPWCSRLSTGSRFNLYNALVCATLAKNILNKETIDKVGIATPYNAQARLINQIIKDWKLSEKVHVSTIHRFQGGEEPVIIFDTVEATGVRIAPMLDSSKADSDADLLLNVAITRAESKFYIIGHMSHLLSELNPYSSLARLLKYIEQKGEVRQSNDFVDNYLVTDFEKHIQTPPMAPIEKNDGNLFTEKNFWRQFDEDLNKTSERLIILSPFLSIRRSDHFMNRFQNLVAKGIEIRIYTRPKNQQTGEMAHQAEVVIDHMRDIGIKVFERRSMHQKVAIIDNDIAWEGSLNILSHRDTEEQMRRFEGQSTIREIIKNLELDQNDGAGTISEKICPECGKVLVHRQSRFGKFLGCSGYPKCKYIDKSERKSKKSSTYKKRRYR